MANYPALRIANEASEGWTDPILISRARSASVKARRLGAGKKRTFKILHERVTAADKATLEAFYDANRTSTFIFTILGVSYTCIFGDSELPWKGLPMALWSVNVTLLEV